MWLRFNSGELYTVVDCVSKVMEGLESTNGE